MSNSSARKARLPALLVAAAVGGPTSFGATLTLGSSNLDVPASVEAWVRRDLPDGVLMQRVIEPSNPRQRKGFALLLLGAPRAANAFEQDFAAFARTPRQVPATKALVTQDGVTSDGHRIHVEQRCCRSTDGIGMNVWHVGIATPGHEQFLMLLTMALDHAAEDTIRDDFQAMVRSLRPTAGDHGFVLAAKPGEGGLDGLYTRTVNDLSPNVFGGLAFTSRQEILLFDPKGLYANEMPKTGDLAALCRGTPQNCGTYAVSGGGFFGGQRMRRLEVTSPFGIVKRADEPLSRQSDTLKIGDTVYRNVRGFHAGQRLSGTWTELYGSSGPAGSVGGSHTLALHPDGRFDREGFVGFATGPAPGANGATVVGNAKRPVSGGRYDLSGYRLTLTNDDGRIETLSIFAPDPSDKLLVIGGGNYLKQGR